MTTPPVTWQWKRFSELGVDGLYRVLALRSEVFVVEQRSLYQDPDGYDRECFHLLGELPRPEGPLLGAYLRVLPPGLKYPEASFGRVVTAPGVRGQRLGHELVKRALAFLEERWPGTPIRIGAQHYLVRFYAGFGFRQLGDVYDEDGIPHVDMVKP
jgi:ElaA protein